MSKVSNPVPFKMEADEFPEVGKKKRKTNKAATSTVPSMPAVSEATPVSKAPAPISTTPPPKISPPVTPPVTPPATTPPPDTATVTEEKPAPVKRRLGPVLAVLRCGQIRGRIVVDARDAFKPGDCVSVQILKVDVDQCTVDVMNKPALIESDAKEVTIPSRVTKKLANEDLRSSLEGTDISVLSIHDMYSFSFTVSKNLGTRLWHSCHQLILHAWE